MSTCGKMNSLKSAICISVVLLFIALHMVVFEQGMGGDGWGYYAILESAVIDHDLNLDNNIYGTYNGFKKDPVSGRWITQYPPGMALMDAPFFMAAERLYPLIGPRLPEVSLSSEKSEQKNISKQTLMRILGVIAAHNFYTLLGLLLLFLTLRKHSLSALTASLLVAATYFTTPLHFYGQSGMSHADSFFCMSALLYLLSGYVQSPRLYLIFLIGMICGLAATVRYVNGVMLIITAGTLFMHTPSGILKKWFLLGIGFLAVFWIVPLFWWLHAHMLKPAYGAKFIIDRPPLLNILFSFKRGLFTFHPALLLIFPGFISFIVKSEWKEARSRFMALFCMLSIIVLSSIYGYYKEWWGAETYSQRYLICILPFCIFCIASLFKNPGFIRIISSYFLVFGFIFSYSIFIISVSQVLTFEHGQMWALYLHEYNAIFNSNISLSDILNGLGNNVYGLKGLRALLG